MRARKHYIITTILILLFIVLAILVKLYPKNSVDIGISAFVQNYECSWLTQLMLLASKFGDIKIALIILFTTAAIFYQCRLKREALFTLLTAPTGIITYILKKIFDRPRPTSAEVHVIESYQNNSFPSGHTLSYVVFFGFIFIVFVNLKKIPRHLKTAILIALAIILILGPLSRIYLGAHWFTDILGGTLIGLAYLLALKSQFEKA